MGSERESKVRREDDRRRVGGLTGRLLAFLARRRSRRAVPRLALIERIALAPRQSLALVEAEGRRILVATSAEGASAFFPIDDGARPAAGIQAVQSHAEPVPQSSAARESEPVAVRGSRTASRPIPNIAPRVS